MNRKKIMTAVMICFLFSGCQSGNADEETVTLGLSDTQAETAVPLTETETETTTVYVPEYTDSDLTVIDWFLEDMTDSETFSDIKNYQYYARSLGLDKDFFLTPEMWEVYYNENLNINKEIDDKEYYLIRLNPYKLLEVYAENNETDVESLCDSLSVTPPQLYYNWGYNPASVNYESNHEKNTVTYSDSEINIFGKYNGEARAAVMKTHLLVIDNAEGVCSYQSSVTNSMEIGRRDSLSAFTEETALYSKYSEAEKSPAFKVNGIGIRAVIPLTLANAHSSAEGADKGVTVMINVSPYAYGCKDEDIIDIMPYIENKQSETNK